MRILHLLSQTELTGAETHAKTLIDRQVQDGHQVFVASDNIHVPLEVPLLKLPVSTSSYWQRRKNLLILKNYVSDNRIDIIHCHSRAAARHGSQLQRKTKAAQVTTLHGRQHYSFSKRWRDQYGIYQIAICENVARSMQHQFRTPSWKLKIIRNPFSLQSYSPVDKKNRAQGTKTLAFIGRSSGPKGERIKRLILSEGAKWLAANPTLHIQIVAGRPERFGEDFYIHLKQLTAKYGPRIEVLGNVTNLRQFLNDCDFVVGSGRVAIEAGLLEIPVFAIGEYCSEGWVSKNNFQRCCDSNFGDIGVDAMEGPFEVQSIGDQIQAGLTAPTHSSLREKFQESFDLEAIHQQVLQVYKSALFKKNVPRSPPALMYHKIPHQEITSKHKIYVTKEDFQRHLQFFKDQGFHTLTFNDLRRYWDLENDYCDFPHKPLLLTFDDGYVDNLRNAEPLLKMMKMRATLFLLADHSITENKWDFDGTEPAAALMTLEQKRSLDPEVWDIGSHGFSHRHLTEISPADVLQELKDSREKLQRDLGREICSVAYPFGSTSPKIAALAQQSGYTFGVNTDQGALHLADDPLAIFRVNIFPNETLSSLKKKTRWWYRRYFFFKRGR